jgi:hypothetical protein
MAKSKRKPTKRRKPVKRAAVPKRKRKTFRGPRYCTKESTFTKDAEGCVQAVSTYIDHKTKKEKTWTCWWCPNNEDSLRGPCEDTMLETDRGCPPIKIVRKR